MQPINKSIIIDDLVLSNISQCVNFFGLGGLCKTYIQSKPVSSASVHVRKASKCWKPDGEQPRLIGVDEHMSRATRINMNRPPLIGI